MLWNSLVEDALRKTYQNAISLGTQARKAEAVKRLSFYHDEQLEYIEAQLKRHFAQPEKLTPCFLNVVKKVINNLSMVYLDSPIRTVDGTEREQTVFKEIVSTTGLTLKMKTVNRYTKLLKTVLIRPVWRKGRMDLDILTPDILDVTWGDTPEDLLSVLITHYPESGRKDEMHYSLWTTEEIRELDYRGNVTIAEPNPYQIVPFVPCWDRCPTSDFWLGGGDDLIIAQEAINEKLTDLLYVIRMQGFGAPWIKGLEDTSYQVFFGPGSVTKLPIDGEMGFAKTNAPIAEILEAIEFLIKQTAIHNSLSASALSTDPTEESGIARIIGNRELEEMRRDDIELFRRYEGQAFEVMKKIWNYHESGRKFSDKATLQIDFFDPKPQTSLKDQAETWDRLMDMGVISPVDVVMERNRDLKTREEALAHLLKLQQEREQLTERSF